MTLAASRISDQLMKRCTVPTIGTGSPNVFAEALATATISKITVPYQDNVPCPKCCQTFVATIIKGSPKVFINGLAASRLSDVAQGISSPIPIIKGSKSVFMT